MHFNRHSNLAGTHAFLSASKSSWLNYDIEKLERTFEAWQMAARGDRLHALAATLIREGVKLRNTKTTLEMYVNDAVGYQMTPEVTLYFSENCYSTADAISFRKNKLRVHDLKTGITPASHRQLAVYAALFCLEYHVKPFDIEIELRIYQNDEVHVEIPDGDDIMHIMDKIRTFDRRIRLMKEEASS